MLEPLKSCGVLVVRGAPVEAFLLMRHPHRWDLPKGHIDPGETEHQCALRELQEETGIPPGEIELDPDFRFTTEYVVRDLQGRLRQKTLVVFLGRLLREIPIVVSEHPTYAWLPWPPAGPIQRETIDPLLDELQRFLA